jgi:hypothetical protein
MAERTFEVSAAVPVDPETAIDFLTDLANHHRLHPFLVSAVVVGEGSSPEGPFQDWRVLERPRLGPLTYPIRFRARLIRTSASSFVSQVLAAPGCTIEAVTTAEAEGGTGTAYLRERSVVRAPRLLLGYMAGQAEHAHHLTMQRLPAVLARAT